MKKFVFIIFTVLTLSSCNFGKTEEADQVDSIKPVQNNPIFADSITPEPIKDTAGLDELAKDSLKLSVMFQRAANDLSQSYKNNDIPTYAKYTHPSIVKMNGGMTKYMDRLKTLFATDKPQFDRIVSGPVKKIAPAIDDEGYGHGWYCLMPVRRFTTVNGKKTMEMQWLGGQTLDMGKNIYFIDITGAPREKILQIMPDLRFVLDEEAEYSAADQ